MFDLQLKNTAKGLPFLKLHQLANHFTTVLNAHFLCRINLALQANVTETIELRDARKTT